VAHVHQGERRDAIRFACGANASHGLPRTQSDKRATAAAMPLSPEHADLNDSEIGRRCGVSHTFVAQLRPHCESEESFKAYQEKEWRQRGKAKSNRRDARKARAEQEAQEQAAAEQQAQPKPAPPEPNRP